MPLVTVAGADHQAVTLSFDSASNAALAKQLAAAITAGVNAHTILPADSKNGPPPTLGGATGEYVQSTNGVTMLPHGYKAVVVTAKDAMIFGSGDNGESVLASKGDFRFQATGGSGTIVTGGGDNSIIIPVTDNGDWSINTGGGNDVILALGGGTDTINPGGGNNRIQLGSGTVFMQSSGNDTILAGNGQETIGALGKNDDLIYGNASKLEFVADQGSTTILGGTGSDTFFGFAGNGTDFIQGGTAGNNLLYAGNGQATLFGGGNNDQLYAWGDKKQVLQAGAGNETLFGGFASGADTFYGGSGADQITGSLGKNTFVAGTGSATVTAGFDKDQFVFFNGKAGGSELIQMFSQGSDKVDLQGYGKNEVANAVKHQDSDGLNTTITLSDHTTITFAGVAQLTANDFVTSPGAGSGSGGKGDHGHGHGGRGDDHGKDHGHGSFGGDDHDDHRSASDHTFKC